MCVGTIAPSLCVISDEGEFSLRYGTRELVKFRTPPRPSPLTPEILARLDGAEDGEVLDQSDLDALNLAAKWRENASTAMETLLAMREGLDYVWAFVENIRESTDYTDFDQAPLEHWLYNLVALIIQRNEETALAH
jgi:hypothetical protein